MGEVQTKITEANTLLSGSINQLTEENKATLKTLTKEMQTLVNEAHKALNDAVKSLKIAVKLKLESAKTAEEND